MGLGTMGGFAEGGSGGGGVPAALTEGLEVLDRGHATLRREAGAAGSESVRVTSPAPQCHAGAGSGRERREV